eukprot:926523-Pelagomonas_calceolata.AAC.2
MVPSMASTSTGLTFRHGSNVQHRHHPITDSLLRYSGKGVPGTKAPPENLKNSFRQGRPQG